MTDDEQTVSNLRVALGLYVRHVRGLTAENLESFQGILESLCEEDALGDPGRRLQLAERVRSTIVNVIEGCSDEIDRRAGNGMFAISKDVHGAGVLSRLADCHVSPGMYYSRRDGLLSRVARGLQREFGAGHSGASLTAQSLSPAAQHAARQLYLYAQLALVRIEAYGLCVAFEELLKNQFKDARLRGVDPTELPHGWLTEYDTDLLEFRLAPTDRCSESDSALWAYAYFHEYLRALLEDADARTFFRENLTTGCWRRIQQGVPFESNDIERMLTALAGGSADLPEAFADDLCADEEGRDVYESWLFALASSSYWPNGHISMDKKEDEGDLDGQRDHSQPLTFDLLMLCCWLQHVFPEETLVGLDAVSYLSISNFIQRGLPESGVPGIRCTPMVVRDLNRDLAARRPPRYVGGEGKAVWNDEPAARDLWRSPMDERLIADARKHRAAESDRSVQEGATPEPNV